MKVIVLNSGKADQSLEEVLVKIKEVLEELQVEVKVIGLSHISYYDGHNSNQITDILDEIQAASGVIMISRIELLSISGSLCTFLEHCSTYKGNLLFQRPLFALTATDWRGEREAAEYMLHAWGILGGLEFGKLGIYTPTYESDKSNILDNVERMTESFYRMMKQNRTTVQSSDYSSFNGNTNIGFAPILEKKLENESGSYSGTVTRVQERKSTQEKDIEDLANFFKGQLTQEKNQKSFIPAPQIKLNKQIISNLPHYFQGQHETDFDSIIQYHVISDEPFSGYLTIKDGDCVFTEGVSVESEIEISADENIFKEVFSKKITSQKAFMLGQIKVRGNFMLLPRLDQMFKKM